MAFGRPIKVIKYLKRCYRDFHLKGIYLSLFSFSIHPSVTQTLDHRTEYILQILPKSTLIYLDNPLLSIQPAEQQLFLT